MNGNVTSLRGAADESGTVDGDASARGMSSFARNIFAMLERTEYRRCESGEATFQNWLSTLQSGLRFDLA